MNNEISNKPCGCGNCEPMCTTCGRPWVVCKGECGCKKPCCNKVNFCEYGRAVPGCIRERAPECPMQAVIPSVVVESVSNLKNLADCFVHVTNINTTFYIDDKHRTMITWAGPVEYDNYDLDTNSLGLRGQFLLDFANNRGAYYDATGGYKKFNLDDSGSKYIVALDWNNSSRADSYNWNVTAPLNVHAAYFMNGMPGQSNSFQMTLGGNSVSAADLLAAGDSLLNASFEFELPVAASPELTEIMTIAAKPTAVTNSELAVVISGTYEVDTTNLFEQLQVISLPPLRWKLAIAKDSGLMTFTVESIGILL